MAGLPPVAAVALVPSGSPRTTHALQASAFADRARGRSRKREGRRPPDAPKSAKKRCSPAAARRVVEEEGDEGGRTAPAARLIS